VPLEKIVLLYMPVSDLKVGARAEALQSRQGSLLEVGKDVP
jgi:hypothetical protein